ncbi:MAG: hypothetical protein KDA89_17235 [Planctomycetaceae bacterium]|nr:hypothetical protein [Planctomycetaceae bacterium]
MARIQLNDIPVLESLDVEEQKGIFGGHLSSNSLVFTGGLDARANSFGLAVNFGGRSPSGFGSFGFGSFGFGSFGSGFTSSFQSGNGI